ncbi:hypothetical protein EVAR_51107_1 [Eumeta japonica]|uniref:Uncharacterized protein n=1 Tax=Eumeta variegata TaxID=151549 RepID=A0A4C1YAY9_EUMVA|nr:hypothetical protein EVAR_51107_1 [Eumeta japonica]
MKSSRSRGLKPPALQKTESFQTVFIIEETNFTAAIAKRACESAQSRWSSSPMGTRNPRVVTNWIHVSEHDVLSVAVTTLVTAVIIALHPGQRGLYDVQTLQYEED